MINAWSCTLFGAGHGIGRPRQAGSERAAAADQEAHAHEQAGQAGQKNGSPEVVHRSLALRAAHHARPAIVGWPHQVSEMSEA